MTDAKDRQTSDGQTKRRKEKKKTRWSTNTVQDTDNLFRGTTRRSEPQQVLSEVLNPGTVALNGLKDGEV